jgi:uncharacterized membrane protein
MEGKTMGTQRLEAFTDGVIAIVITIMVLEIKVPHSASPEALLATLPILLTLCAELRQRRSVLE